MLGLIPMPYRLLAMAALLVAALGAGYVKGITHQQQADELAAAELQRATAAADQRQAAALRPIATQYAQDHAHDLLQLPALQAGIDRFVAGAAVGLRCPAAGAAGAPLPGVRPGPAGQAPALGTDRSGPQAADRELSAHIAHDAGLYRQCALQLAALIDTARAAGADQP